MSIARTQKLIDIERGERQAVEQATEHRNRLITLTSFSSVDDLAGLSRTTRDVEISTTLVNLQLCARRAAELADERKRLG